MKCYIATSERGCSSCPAKEELIAASVGNEKNEKEIIKPNALNFTWYTGLIAIIAPLGAALIALLGFLENRPGTTVLAVFGAIAAGVLAAAIVASADVVARAWISVARERSQANLPTPSAADPTVKPAANPIVLRVPHLHPDPIPVITARWDETQNKTWYLVKEPGVMPVWIGDDQVKGG